MLDRVRKVPYKVYRALWHVVFFHIVTVILDFILPNVHVANRVRGLVIGIWFKSRGRRLAIASGCTLFMVRNLEVGDDVYIAHDVWVNAVGGLSISDGVVISPKVVIATSTHARIQNLVALREGVRERIRIDRGAWIASGAVITKGCTIGQGAIVGANSVVTKDVEPNWLYAGQPAHPVKFLGDGKDI